MRGTLRAHESGLLLGLAIALFVGDAVAQEVPRLRLGPVTGETEKGFTRLENLRELSDGRLLLPDLTEEALYVVDFDDTGSGAVRQVGRQGEGPGEYGRPVAVFPLARDSSLLRDGLLDRWFVLQGTEFVETLTARLDFVRWTESIEGTGASGVLTLRGAHWGEGVQFRTYETADSVALVVLHRPWETPEEPPRVDTIGVIPGGGPTTMLACFGGALARGTGARGGYTSSCRTDVKARPEALLLPDGWLAVAYQDPYRVDWRSPDGKWIRGAPVDEEPVDMTFLERCAAAQGWSFRGVGMCSREDLAEREFPDILPPFVRAGSTERSGDRTAVLQGTPDRRLLVRRTPTSKTFMYSIYDVFDRTGARTGSIRLPGDQAVLGFGERSIYTIRTDEVDLQWVRRHDWPLLGR